MNKGEEGMSLLDQSKVVSLRCEDCAEVISLIRHNWSNGDVDYEIVVEDAYCGGGYSGFFGRIRRAWSAFWAQPISYTGVYIEGKDRVRDFLEECMQLIANETELRDNQG